MSDSGTSTDSGSPEDEVSWRAIVAHSPVIASDGTEIGRVLEVAALVEEDIFHGIVFQHHGRGRTYLAPADDVSRITERAVYLGVDQGHAESYPEFHEENIERLGVKGLFFWKHLGWKRSSE
jgi:hypothetical protein